MTYCTSITVEAAFHYFSENRALKSISTDQLELVGKQQVQNSQGSVACIRAFMLLWMSTLTEAASVPPQQELARLQLSKHYLCTEDQCQVAQVHLQGNQSDHRRCSGKDLG